MKSLVRIAIYCVVLLGLYYSAIQWLIVKDWAREDFSYGYLIPPLVLYLLWEKRASLRNVPLQPSWTGLLPFLAGIMLYWLGELAGEFFSVYVSFWFVVVGIVWMQFGWRMIKAIWFPLFIMLTMFPLPNFIFQKLAFQLKLVSSQLGVGMMQLYGMSAFREGNVIDLGFTQLQVIDACSGLRYLIPLIVLSILIAYFYKTAIWKKLVIVASSIPLSVITNSLRIALTGILYESWGPAVAEGFFHGFSGWFIFMFSLAVLLAEIWILQKLVPEKRKHDEQWREPASIESLSDTRQQGKSPLLYPPQSFAAILILALTLVFSQGIEFREKIPAQQSFARFPLSLGEWTGTRQTMEQVFIDTLDLSDYTMIDYEDAKGRSVSFYVAYYESQRKGESIHSPETCLPGGGWVFNQSGTVTIPNAESGKGSMVVNRAFMQKSDYRQLVYFWFPQRGRILTNAYQMKIYTFWDALTRHRTDGALVRLITPVYPNEDIQCAEQRLQGFTQKIVPVLNAFIPQ